jgi:hypothetical protein
MKNTLAAAGERVVTLPGGQAEVENLGARFRQHDVAELQAAGLPASQNQIERDIAARKCMARHPIERVDRHRQIRPACLRSLSARKRRLTLSSTDGTNRGERTIGPQLIFNLRGRFQPKIPAQDKHSSDDF